MVCWTKYCIYWALVRANEIGITQHFPYSSKLLHLWLIVDPDSFQQVCPNTLLGYTSLLCARPLCHHLVRGWCLVTPTKTDLWPYSVNCGSMQCTLILVCIYTMSCVLKGDVMWSLLSRAIPDVVSYQDYIDETMATYDHFSHQVKLHMAVHALGLLCCHNGWG